MSEHKGLFSRQSSSERSERTASKPTEQNISNYEPSSEKRSTRIGTMRLIQYQRKKIEKSLQILNGYIQHVLDNMMGYVAMPSILKKIVKDHGMC
jgi:hypothetical protein